MTSLMTFRSAFAIALLIAAPCTPALAQQAERDASTAPVLRASVTVNSEVVRIGDLVDNAGVAAQVAIYRAPDLGTTGSLRTAKVLEVLRAN
ncbi:MAG TPA: flagellar basal body P-ring formation protein FlgA, partial [Afipia sp.]